MLIYMYSPQIAKHTPRIYRVSRVVGKPMTRVADDLISFACQHLKSVYIDIDEEQIKEILRAEYDPDFGKDKLLIRARSAGQYVSAV